MGRKGAASAGILRMLERRVKLGLQSSVRLIGIMRAIPLLLRGRREGSDGIDGVRSNRGYARSRCVGKVPVYTGAFVVIYGLA